MCNGDRIPNALDRVASAALTLRDVGPWSASVQLRQLGLGALTEDNRVRARASTLTNLRLSYKIGPDARWMLDVFTLFDREADDIQYVEASRLRGEAEAVADRHVHPAEPRSARLTLHLRH